MNSFNAGFGARLGTRVFPRRSLHKRNSQNTPRQRLIAFALEGSPLDCCQE
jgi:hypothetical protein